MLVNFSSSLKSSAGIVPCELKRFPKPLVKYLNKNFFSEYFIITLQQTRETYAHLRTIIPVVNETTEADLVPVRNGVYNTSTKQLEPFTPERVFLTKSPVRYNPQAVSPTKTLSDGSTWTFDEWLADLFSEDEERVTLYWEILAASLRVYKSYEKAFFFLSSSGSSGKSTLLHLMRNILGQRNCASLSP